MKTNCRWNIIALGAALAVALTVPGPAVHSQSSGAVQATQPSGDTTSTTQSTVTSQDLSSSGAAESQNSQASSTDISLVDPAQAIDILKSIPGINPDFLTAIEAQTNFLDDYVITGNPDDITKAANAVANLDVMTPDQSANAVTASVDIPVFTDTTTTDTSSGSTDVTTDDDSASGASAGGTASTPGGPTSVSGGGTSSGASASGTSSTGATGATGNNGAPSSGVTTTTGAPVSGSGSSDGSDN